MFFNPKFYVFPVNRKTKIPLIKHMLDAASNDTDQILAWMKKFPTCNWGLSLAKSGLVAVDVDVNHGGLAFWYALASQNGDPTNTLMARTGGGGLHYVFNAKLGTKYKGKITRGIDIKHNGLIVIFPSLHKSGKNYEWINDNEIQDYPEWIGSLIEKKFDTSPDVAFPVNISNTFLLKCVEILKTQELSYEEWLQAGMAIHSAMPNLNGKSLFLDLTSGASFQEGDFEQAEYKWQGFEATGGISVKTLSHLIREKGLTPPKITEAEDLEALRQIAKSDYERRKLKDLGFTLNAEDQYTCLQHNLLVKFFNDNGFAFCDTDPKAPIIKITYSDSGKHFIQSMNTKGLLDKTAPYFFSYFKDGRSAFGNQLIPASKVWFESASRKEIKRIVFKPSEDIKDPNTLNLWAGFPLIGNKVEGDPEALLEMILVSLCNDDKRKYDWLLDWLAHIIQKPQEKATTVPVFIGYQGTGKGILADHVMMPLLGELYVGVTSTTQLTQQFNSHLACRLLTHIDESTWRGNKTEDGIMKNIIGAPTLSIEEKFKARYTIENFSRYMISSNNQEAVALEQGNRRYCVIETSAKWANNSEKFRRVLEAIKYEDEVSRFYNFLLKRDLSKFNPFQILEGNTAGKESKIATSGIVAEFWYDTFYENPRPIVENGRIVKSKTYEEFIDFAKRVSTYERNYTPKRFWSDTIKALPSLNIPSSNIKNKLGTWEKQIPIKSIHLLKGEFSRRLSIEDEETGFDANDYHITCDFKEIEPDFFK